MTGVDDLSAIPTRSHAFVLKHPASWGLQNVTEVSTQNMSMLSSSLHVVVAREPVDRYVSAFYSKIACCGNATNEARRGHRHSCMQDRSDAPTLVNQLARLANRSLPSRPCLYFDEYVAALGRVQELGRQHNLNGHLIPQTLACPYATQSPTLLTNASGLSTVLAGLPGFFRFHRISPMRRDGVGVRIHATRRDVGPAERVLLDASSLKALQVIAAPETYYLHQQCGGRVLRLPLTFSAFSKLDHTCYIAA